MYCTDCGTENDNNARFCRSCGQSVLGPTSSANNFKPATSGDSGSGAAPLRTATMVLGLIAAVFLLITGCTAYVTGGFFEAVDEVGLVDVDESEGSTAEEISIAGALALIVAIILFVGAGLAKATWKPSFGLLIATLGGLILLVTIDTWSLFATVYYLAIVLVGVSLVLMWRSRKLMD